MMIRVLAIIFAATVFNVASAESVFKNAVTMRSAQQFAVQMEKEIFFAEEVQIMDSYSDGNRIFVTVGPEKEGRAARTYHCWVTGVDVKGRIISRARISNHVCRQL
jgi:hypothetical protein